MSKKVEKGPVPSERIEELVRVGRRRTSITAILAMEGYSQEEINKAFADYQIRQEQRMVASQQPPKEVEKETRTTEKPTIPSEEASAVSKPLVINDVPPWNPPPSVKAEQLLSGAKPNETTMLIEPVKRIAATVNSLGESLMSLRKNLEEDRSILKNLNTKIVEDLNTLEKRVDTRVSSMASTTQSNLSSIAANITGQIKDDVVERLNKIIDSLDRSQASSQKMQLELRSLKSFLNSIVDEQTKLLKRIEEIERKQSESRSEIRGLRAAMREKTED